MTVRSLTSKFKLHDWPQSRQDYDATAHISYVLSRLPVIDCECGSSIEKRCIELPMLHHQPFLLQVGIGTAMFKTSVDSNNSHRHWPHWMVAKYCDDSVFWSPVRLYFNPISRFTEFNRKGEFTRTLWFCFPPGMLWEIQYRYDLAGLGYGGSNRQDWCSDFVGRWHILLQVRIRLLSLLEGSRLYDSLLCRTDGTSGDF